MGVPAVESNGSAERTETLYREHGAAVAAFCSSLLRDRADAEDATQQVFLSVHRALLNGAVPREPLAWLLAVARNECYARFRQRAAVPVPTGDAPEGATADASVHVLRAGEFARVWEEVERMPAAQREAFLLREIRGLSYGQLADELSLSRPSVRSLLLRARTRLRQRLGDVATALGGVPWAQSLFRALAGGDGTSTVPAAAKAVAVGLGAAALAGGATAPRVVHHASSNHASANHRAQTRTRHIVSPQPAAVRDLRLEARMSREAGSPVEASTNRDGSSGTDAGSLHGGEDETVATAPVVQPTTSGDGRDGGGSSSSGPGSGSVTTTTTMGSSGSDGGSSSSSGPGPGSVTTTTTSSSSGSGSSGSGSGSGTTDGGGGSHDGGGSGSDDGSGGHGG